MSGTMLNTDNEYPTETIIIKCGLQTSSDWGK